MRKAQRLVEKVEKYKEERIGLMKVVSDEKAEIVLLTEERDTLSKAEADLESHQEELAIVAGERDWLLPKANKLQVCTDLAEQGREVAQREKDDLQARLRRSDRERGVFETTNVELESEIKHLERDRD